MENNTHKVDELLRQRLAELPLPLPRQEGWWQLERALDQETDEVWRQALVTLQPTSGVQGWQALSRKIDEPAAMDAQLAHQLDSLRPLPPSGSWDKLSERIDHALGAEVDTVVTRRLNQETAGPVSGWATLAARLELVSMRRQLVGAAKITEVTILMSIVLLLLRFGPEAQSDTALALKAGFPVGPSPVLVNTLPPAPEVYSETVETIPAKTVSLDLEQLPNNAVVANSTPLPDSGDIDGETAAVEDTTRATENDSQFLPIQRLAASAEARVVGPTPDPRLPLIELPAASIRPEYRLNVFIAPWEINQVVTPQGAVNEIDVVRRKRYSFSSAVGGLLDISTGSNSFRTGVILSRYGYEPTELLQTHCLVEGNCPEGYERFVYRTLRLPLSYERTLRDRDQWRLATSIGLVTNIITHSEFAWNGEAREAVAYSLLQQRNNSRSITRSSTINRNQLLNPEPGWLQGGGFLNNASFYLSGGFTVERAISPRFSLYVSPEYSRAIFLRNNRGVGPYNDRIHQASMRVGSRFLLGKE